MILSEILQTILIISAFCVGLRIISDREMILYFLRFHYELGISKKKGLVEWRDEIEGNDEMKYISKEEEAFIKKRIRFHRNMIILQKPFIGCVACMASVHGLWIFYFLHGIRWEAVLCCMGAAGVNAIVHSFYEG